MKKNRSPKDSRPTPLDKVIGQSVKELRLAKNMTQEQFCEEWGSSKALLSLLERGEKPWNSNTLYAAMKVLGVGLPELSGGVTIAPEDKPIFEAIRKATEIRGRIDSERGGGKKP